MAYKCTSCNLFFPSEIEFGDHLWERHLKLCPICTHYVTFGSERENDIEADIDIHIYLDHEIITIIEDSLEEEEKEKEETNCEECRLNANYIYTMGNQLIHTCAPYRF